MWSHTHTRLSLSHRTITKMKQIAEKLYVQYLTTFLGEHFTHRFLQPRSYLPWWSFITGLPISSLSSSSFHQSNFSKWLSWLFSVAVTFHHLSKFQILCLHDQNPPDLILTFHSFSTIIILSNVLRGFPGGSDGKESACNVGDPSSNPGLGRSPGEGNGNPLQYSCLENPKDKEAWQATVHGVAKKSDTTKRWTFHFISSFIHYLLIKLNS